MKARMPDEEGILSNEEIGEMLEQTRWEYADAFTRFLINWRRRREGKLPFPQASVV